MMEDKNLINI